MELKIKEVEKYFKDKILSKDFKIDFIKEHTMRIVVDNKYNFTIWIGNFNYHNTVGLYYADENYMCIDFNVKERLKLHSKIKKDVLIFKENILKNEKLKEFNRLKKELEL